MNAKSYSQIEDNNTGGEAVDEDTFRQQINTYETEDVTGYEPKRHG